MGKKIGIKLADGTFYPIMEDGVPQKKLMELTTVQDNQTTASIDLYRSESGTMDDAEYVESLELSELVPHPGGETSISFTIQLDENNMLSAEVVDSESGKTSATQAHLVNLPSDQRRDSSDYTLSEVSDIDFEEPPLPEAPINGPAAEATEIDFAETEAPQADGAVDLNLADFDLDDFATVDSLPSVSLSQEDAFPSGADFSHYKDDSPEESPAVYEMPASIDDLPDFGDVSLDLDNDQNADGGRGGSQVDPVLSDLDLDDFASIDGDSHLDALLGKDDSLDESAQSLPSIPDLPVDSFDLPDFNENTLDAKSSDDFSFDAPDFNFGNEKAGFTSTEETQPMSVYEDSLPDFSNFELPDFDDTPKNNFSFEKESGLFTENDFRDPAFYTTDSQSAAAPLDFTGLYDDTENELIKQENRKRRSSLAVVVCVICALICIGILLFILFLLPGRLSTQATAGSQLAAGSQTDAAAQELEVQPDVTAAVEDVIVIVDTPSVVPAPPPQVAGEPAAVKYKVKWGDTLWDIAQSYYNNPWLYKRIAAVNNISNPDYIVAGTILTIPPQ